ncbi:MAG: SGNH/GDSL hydrolase family protein, partial [Thermobispora bispora]|nr:SGNH/GDSL hydrolase family protein [Thermobispora bispora]
LVLKRLKVVRSNWKGSGLPDWNPQTMFPAEELLGGGRVPTNIMLGILAQESNLWQAQGTVMEGETGNPLIGNYYGVNVYDDNPGNDWEIDFSEADCGYGISQQTDGMRKAGSERPGETALPPNMQKAVAMDYVTNIAAGLRTLTQKWNQIWDDTDGAMIVNDGSPAQIENWYFAVWAYNSGWHPKQQANQNGGAWGLGWANNPSNPIWRPGRHPFLDGNSYMDAAHPQYWPYQEKVLGWAAWPITKTYYDASAQKWATQAGFNPAWWNSSDDRSRIVPTLRTISGTFVVDVNAFCVPTAENGNQCQPGNVDYENPQNNTPGICSRDDSKCWWHFPKVWKTACYATCGNEGVIRYSDPIYESMEREEPTDYWYPCLTPGLPSNSLIIDDVPQTVPAIRGGCDNSGWMNSGTFSFQFGSDAAGRELSKADFHQLGNGFGGHEWYAYARDSQHLGNEFQVTGTWRLDREINGWARVLVHVPARRAWSQRAPYTIKNLKDRGYGTTQTRTLQQRMESNTWLSLGVFEFDGVPEVSLTNLVRSDPTDSAYTPDPSVDGTTAIAWDAIAIQPLPRKPANFVVAMGDSYSSGEGASRSGGVDYYRNSNNNGSAQDADDPRFPRQSSGNPRFRNACHRSKESWQRKALLPDDPHNTIGTRADTFDPDMDYHMVACSGAQTENVLSYSQGRTNAFGDSIRAQYGELTQIDQGYLDWNTTLVTISIGGNDAGFSTILQSCLYPLPFAECQDNVFSELNDTTPLTDAEPKRIDGPVRSSIIQALKAIHEKAPNARIILMGYPYIFSAPCQFDTYPDFIPDPLTQGEFEWITQTTGHMDEMLSALPQDPELQGIPVKFADPRQAFLGYGACSGGTEAIHKIVRDMTPGDMAGLFSSQSFHPNTFGTTLYAQVLTNALAAQ